MRGMKGLVNALARTTRRNIITNKEKTAIINKSNQKLIKDFLSYLKAIQRSPKTIDGYGNDLLITMTYILDYVSEGYVIRLTHNH